MGLVFHVNGAPIGALAVLVAVFSSMGGFLFGYDTGQISDFLQMNDFKRRFASCPDLNALDTCEFSNVRSGLIVSLLSIGTLFGALFGAAIADRLGRKKAIVVDNIVLIIGVVVQISSVSAWYQFMIGRIIAGLGVGALSAVVPLYQSEIAPKEIRGTLVCTYQLMITAGILVAYCISIGTRHIEQNGAEWRIPNGLTMFFSLFLMIGILFAPESPRWLFGEGRYDDAERSLARIRGVKVEDNDYSVRQTYEEMKLAVEHEARMDKFRWIDCFRPRDKMLYRTVMLAVLQAGQQLTGANYFFYYGTTVFQSVGNVDPFVSQIILGAVNFGCTFLGLYIMERFGRRWPLIIGGLWQSAWLFVYAAAGTAKDPTENKSIGTLLIVSSCLFILGYASTVLSRPRATGSLIAFFTPFITGSIGFSYGFVFAGCNLFNALFAYFFLYESAGLSLESVDRMYNDPNIKPWNSHKWVPPGAESRHDYIQGLQAERKTGGEKPVHRELADDGSSHDGTVVGSENPAKLGKHGRKPAVH
ncbi:hypothetical protein NBRC10512_003774 [Rhodotorula toruloides]